MTAGSTSMWTRFGRGSVQRAVPTSSSREPTTTTASASGTGRSIPGRPATTEPAHQSSSAAIDPAPVTAVATGAPRRIASSRSSRDAFARWMPAPGMITIRRAPSRSRAAATIESGSGATRPGISTAGVSPVNARPDDIGRHLDVGRSRPARHRAAERLGDRRRDRLGGARPADIGGDRLERPALVGRLVQDAAAEAVERGVDLAGQQHDRRRVRPRLGERGERVERARAGRRRQDARADPASWRSRRRRTRPPARGESGCAGWTVLPASAS